MFTNTRGNPFLSVLKKAKVGSGTDSASLKPDKSDATPREKLIPDNLFGKNLLSGIEAEQHLSLEDGRITKAYFDRLKMLEFGCLVVSLIGIGLSVMQYDLEFSESHPEWSLFLLYYIFVSSLLLSVMTIVRYLFHLEFKKKRNLISPKETIFTTGSYKNLLLEIAIVMIIPYPWLKGIRVYTYNLESTNVVLYYHVNEILVLFSMLRLAIVLRVVLLTSIWNSNRAQRICEMYAVQPGALFTLKCIMRTNPFFLIFTALLCSIPYFGYMVRIAERPFTRIKDNLNLNFDYANAMWNVIITMTTVGYGDYYPRTILGRTVIFFVCIWGTTIISLMVITLTNTLEMSSLEGKSFIVMQRLIAKEQLREKAAYIITNLVRAKLRAKKGGNITENINKIKTYLKSFKKATRQSLRCTDKLNFIRLYKEFSAISSGFEEMERQFEFMRDQVKDVVRQEKYLIESNKLVMNVLGIEKNVLDKLENNLKSSIFGMKHSIVSQGGIKSRNLTNLESSQINENAYSEYHYPRGPSIKMQQNVHYFDDSQRSSRPISYPLSRKSS